MIKSRTELTIEQEPAASLAGTEQSYGRWLEEPEKWCTFGVEASPFVRYNPVRPLIIWYNLRRMNNSLSPRIENRFSENRNETNDSISGNKSIIDLVLRAYLSDNRKEKLTSIGSTFKNFTVNQIKLFFVLRSRYNQQHNMLPFLHSCH